MLTVSSYPTRTSVVLRGKYLLENILNAPPPPPPPDVPALNEATVGVAQIAAPADGSSTAPTRSAPPAIPGWICSASAWRTTTPSAAGAPRTANSRWMPAARSPMAKTFNAPRR